MKKNTVAAIVTTTPSGVYGTFTLMARELVRKRLARLVEGTVLIRDPQGEWFAGAGNHINVSVHVHDMDFYQQILVGGSKAVATAWRDGLWSCTDLTTLLRIMTRNIELLDGFESGTAKLLNLWTSLQHRLRSNTRKGSQANIHAHYDLGNEMFRLFLDPTMTYSAAIFRNEHMTLEQASIEKLDTICRKLELDASHHLIEIGTGWGSFAIHAASRYGCKVTTTTISKDQFELAKQRIAAAGLQDRITLLLCDYRDLQGKYDRLVSIEMIEAVGHDYLPQYFSQCASLLKADGRALIQAITMPDQRYAQYLTHTDFIQQYIFPGSCVPSLTAMTNAVAGNTDLRIENVENIGPHYATTLRCWLDNFMTNRDKIAALGYDEKFLRLWEYYLCYCEAGFRERYLGNVHLLMHKPTAGRPTLGSLDPVNQT